MKSVYKKLFLLIITTTAAFNAAALPKTYAYVANTELNSVSIIDADNDTYVGEVSGFTGKQPGRIKVSDDGKEAYVLSWGNNTFSRVNTATHTQIAIDYLDSFQRVFGLGYGGYFFSKNDAQDIAYDAHDHMTIEIINKHNETGEISFIFPSNSFYMPSYSTNCFHDEFLIKIIMNQDSTRGYVLAQDAIIKIDPIEKTIIDKIDISYIVSLPHDMAISPDSKMLYVLDDIGQLVRVNLEDHDNMDKNVIFNDSGNSLAVSPDGKKAYITLSNKDYIQVVNLESMQLAGIITGNFLNAENVAFFTQR